MFLGVVHSFIHQHYHTHATAIIIITRINREKLHLNILIPSEEIMDQDLNPLKIMCLLYNIY